MSTVTRSDVVNRAMSKLGLIASGQSPEAEDQAIVDGIFDPVVAELAERSICYVASEDEIPVEWQEPISDVLAQRAAPDFGRATDENVIAAAESRLRKMTLGKPSYAPLKVDYY